MGKLETLITPEQYQLDSQSEIPNPKDMLFLSVVENEIYKMKEEECVDITDYSVNEFKIPDLDILNNEKYPNNYSVSFQSWLGHVIEIRTDSFIAELRLVASTSTGIR